MSIGPVGGPGLGDALELLRSGRIQGDESLEVASRLIEGSFYQELFKAMRETIPEGGAIPGGMGQDIFEGLLDERFAESAALKAEGGLADALYRYFKGYDSGESGSVEAQPPAAAHGLRTPTEE